MIKKIVVAVGLAFSLSFLVGCGNKSLVEQGKAAIKQGNYEEATAIFKAASEEDSKDKEEAESLYDLTYNYVISNKAYNEFKLDVALDSLKKVEENKNKELMKEDITSLKEEISKDKSVLDDFYSSMEKVNDLESEGKISEARDLLNKSLKNISYLGENVKELIASGNSKLKNLDEKLDKKAVIISFEREYLEALRKLLPETEMMLLVHAPTKEDIDFCLKIGNTGIDYNHKDLYKSIGALKYARENGVKIGAWTVDNPLYADFAVHFGAELITTNKILP